MSNNINSSSNLNSSNVSDIYTNIKRLDSNNVKGSIKSQKKLVRQLSNNIKNLKIKYNNSSSKLTSSVNSKLNLESKTVDGRSESSRLLVVNRRSIPLVQYLNHNLYAVRTPWRYISREDTLRNNIDELLNFFKLFQKLYDYSYYSTNIVYSKRKQYSKPQTFFSCGVDSSSEDLESLEYEYLVKFHDNVYSKITLLFHPLNPRPTDESTTLVPTDFCTDPNRNTSSNVNKYVNSDSSSSNSLVGNKTNINNQNVLCCGNKFYGIKTFGERVLNHQKYVVIDLCSDCTTSSFNDGKLKYEFLNEFNKQIVEIKLNKYFLPSLSNIFKVVSIALFWVKFDFNFVVINYNRINFNVLLLFACVILLFSDDFSYLLTKDQEITNEYLTNVLNMLEHKLLNTLKWREFCDSSFEQYSLDQSQNKVGVLSKKDLQAHKMDAYHQEAGRKEKLDNITEMYWIYKWPPSYKRYLLYYVYINNKILKERLREKEEDVSSPVNKDKENRNKEREQVLSPENKTNEEGKVNKEDENMNYVYDERDAVDVLEKKYYELNSITLYNCLMPNYSIDIEVYQMGKDNDLYNYDDPNYVNGILNYNLEESQDVSEQELLKKHQKGNYFNHLFRSNNNDSSYNFNDNGVLNLDCLNYRGVTFNSCKCRCNFNNTKLLVEKNTIDRSDKDNREYENNNDYYSSNNDNRLLMTGREKEEEKNKVNHEQEDSVGEDAVLMLCPHNYVKQTVLGTGSKRQSHPSSSFNFDRHKKQVKNHYIDKVVYDYSSCNDNGNKRNIVYDDVCIVFVLRVNKVDRKVICSYSFNTSMLENGVVNNYSHNGFKINRCGVNLYSKDTSNTTDRSNKDNKDNGVELVLGVEDLDMWYKNLFLEDSYFVLNLTPIDVVSGNGDEMLINNVNNNLGVKSYISTPISLVSECETPKGYYTNTIDRNNKDKDEEASLNKEDDTFKKVNEGVVEKEYYKFYKNGNVYNFINNHVKWVNMVDVYNLYKLTNHNIETIVLSLKICNSFSESLNLLINLKKPYHSNYYNNNVANYYYYNKVNEGSVDLVDESLEGLGLDREVVDMLLKEQRLLIEQELREKEEEGDKDNKEVNKLLKEKLEKGDEDRLFSRDELNSYVQQRLEDPLFSSENIAALNNKLLLEKQQFLKEKKELLLELQKQQLLEQQHEQVEQQNKDNAAKENNNRDAKYKQQEQQDFEKRKLYVDNDLLLKLKESNIVSTERLNERNLVELDNENLVKLLSYSNLSLDVNLIKTFVDSRKDSSKDDSSSESNIENKENEEENKLFLLNKKQQELLEKLGEKNRFEEVNKLLKEIENNRDAKLLLEKLKDAKGEKVEEGKKLFGDAVNVSNVEKELLLLLKNYDEEERKKIVENIKKNQLLYLSKLNLDKKLTVEKLEEQQKLLEKHGLLLQEQQKLGKLIFVEENQLLEEGKHKQELLEQHKLFVEEYQKLLLTGREKEEEEDKLLLVGKEDVEKEADKDKSDEESNDVDSNLVLNKQEDSKDKGETKELLLTTELNIKTPGSSTADLLLLEQKKREEKFLKENKDKENKLLKEKLEEQQRLTPRDGSKEVNKLLKDEREEGLGLDSKEKEHLDKKEKGEKKLPELKPLLKKGGDGLRLKKGGKAPPPPKTPFKSVKRVLPLGIKLHWKPLLPNKLNNSIFQLNDGSTINILNNIFTNVPKGSSGNMGDNYNSSDSGLVVGRGNLQNGNISNTGSIASSSNNDLINVITIKKLFSRSSIGSGGNISTSTSSINMDNTRVGVGNDGVDEGNMAIKKIKSAASLIEQNKIVLLDNKRAQNISIILRYNNLNEYMDMLNKINALEYIKIRSGFRKETNNTDRSNKDSKDKDDSSKVDNNANEMNVERVLEKFREEVEILNESSLVELVDKLNIIYPSSNEIELLLNNYNYQLSNYDENDEKEKEGDSNSVSNVNMDTSSDNTTDRSNKDKDNNLVGVDETYNVKVLEKYRYIERILLELILRKNIYGKIKLIKLMVDINNSIKIINEQLEIYNKAVSEIKSNVILPILLNIILKYGNYINYGNIDQGDIGFTLSSTVKLMDFKSFDNNISSLHYLILNLYIKLYLVSNPHLDVENMNQNVDIGSPVNKDSNNSNTSSKVEEKMDVDGKEKKENEGTSDNNIENKENNKNESEEKEEAKKVNSVEENLDKKLLNIDVELKNVLLAEKISSRGITENLNELSSELFNIISYFNITPGGSGVNSARMLDSESMSSGGTYSYNAGISTSSSSSSNTARSNSDVDINRKINNVINIYKLKLNGVNEYRKDVFENVVGIWLYLGEDVGPGSSGNMGESNSGNGGNNECGSNLDLERIFAILSELVKCIKKIFNDIKSKPVKYLILLNNDAYKHIFLRLFMDNKALANYYKNNKT